MVVCQKTKKWNSGGIHRITWKALWAFKFFIRYYVEFLFYSRSIDVPILSYGQIFRVSDFFAGRQFDTCRQFGALLDVSEEFALNPFQKYCISIAGNLMHYCISIASLCMLSPTSND
jgi:hypothetical protein